VLLPDLARRVNLHKLDKLDKLDKTILGPKNHLRHAPSIKVKPHISTAKVLSRTKLGPRETLNGLVKRSNPQIQVKENLSLCSP